MSSPDCFACYGPHGVSGSLNFYRANSAFR